MELKQEVESAMEYDKNAARYLRSVGMSTVDVGKSENVEYRAMTWLLVHIVFYIVAVQSTVFLIIGTYLSTGGREVGQASVREVGGGKQRLFCLRFPFLSLPSRPSHPPLLPPVF